MDMRIAIGSIVVLLCAALSPAQKAAQPHEMYKGPCWDNAMNQMQMNGCAGDDLKQADDQLNTTYRQLLAKMKEHSMDTAALVAVERQWLAYRDAELSAQYPLAPDENPSRKYGSIYPMRSAELKALLTWQRTKVLQVALENYK
jgi:uncharacterized protein YecT (DUF1311 family)